MTANQNPADAVREAPLIAWLREESRRVKSIGIDSTADRLFDAAEMLAALTARVDELESDAERIASCPWRVQKGCTALCQPPKSLSDALQRAEQAEARLAALAGAGPVGDESMALHWIDRYAAGIDDEPQMDRIREALAITPAEDSDWYVSPQGSVCFDLDLDGDTGRQLSFIAKRDGSVSFVAFVYGQKFIGNATGPGFAEVIAALAHAPAKAREVAIVAAVENALANPDLIGPASDFAGKQVVIQVRHLRSIMERAALATFAEGAE